MYIKAFTLHLRIDPRYERVSSSGAGLRGAVKLKSHRYWVPYPVRPETFVEIDHEIFSAVIFPLPLIQEGQLSATGEVWAFSTG